MRNNNANSDKTAGFRSKPVTVELNGQTIDAAHHITSKNNRLLHLYIDARDGGIDVTVPLCSDKSPYARSEAGRRALGIDSHCAGDDSEHELVADGGRDAVKFAEDVDYVEYDGDGYLVYGAVTRETLEICQVNKRPITVPVDECTPTDVYGNPLSDDDDGERLVTDGGLPHIMNMSQFNGDTRPLSRDDDDDDDANRTIDEPEGPCENPLCCDDVCSSTECHALVRDARCVQRARYGYDALLMPTADRETIGAVLAALNRQGRLDGGDV